MSRSMSAVNLPVGSAGLLARPEISSKYSAKWSHPYSCGSISSGVGYASSSSSSSNSTSDGSACGCGLRVPDTVNSGSPRSPSLLDGNSFIGRGIGAICCLVPLYLSKQHDVLHLSEAQSCPLTFMVCLHATEWERVAVIGRANAMWSLDTHRNPVKR